MASVAQTYPQGIRITADGATQVSDIQTYLVRGAPSSIGVSRNGKVTRHLQPRWSRCRSLLDYRSCHASVMHQLGRDAPPCSLRRSSVRRPSAAFEWKLRSRCDRPLGPRTFAAAWSPGLNVLLLTDAICGSHNTFAKMFRPPV